MQRDSLGLISKAEFCAWGDREHMGVKEMIYIFEITLRFQNCVKDTMTVLLQEKENCHRVADFKSRRR